MGSLLQLSWIDHAIARMVQKGMHKKDITKKACWTYAMEVALFMYAHDRVIIQALTQDPQEAVFFQKVLARKVVPLKQLSKQVASFLHKSLQEYLAARILYQHITKLAQQKKPLDLAHVWNIRHIQEEPSMISFLHDMIRNNKEAPEAFVALMHQATIQEAKVLQSIHHIDVKNKETDALVRTLTHTIEACNNKKATFAWQSRIAAANSATVLTSMGMLLHTRNFAGICMQGAILDGARMSHVNFQNAIFITISCQGVNWMYSNFTGALMHQIDFQEYPKKMFENEVIVYLRWLGKTKVMVETDKAIYTWDSENGEVQKGSVPILDKKGNQIATWQDITTIPYPCTIFDPKTNKYLWEKPLPGIQAKYAQFSSDGSFLFLENTDWRKVGELRIIDVKKGQQIGHAFSEVGEFQPSSDGSFLFLKNTSPKYHDLLHEWVQQVGELRIIDVKKGGKIGQTFKNVHHFQPSSDDSFLFLKNTPLDEYGDQQVGELRIIDVKKAQQIGHALHKVRSYEYAKQDNMLSVLHTNGTCSMWQLAAGKAIMLWKTGAPELTLARLNFANARGLSTVNRNLLKQGGAVVNDDDFEDCLLSYLSHTKISKWRIQFFKIWMHKNHWDEENIREDVSDPKESNIKAYDKQIFQAIQAFLDPSRKLPTQDNKKDSKNFSLYHYYPTISHIQTMIEGCTFLAKLCAHLRRVGFDGLSVQNFRHWLVDHAMDEDALLMDMHERNNSNIYTYSSALYDAIQNFLHPSDAHTSKPQTVQTTYSDQNDEKDDEKTE